MAEYDIFVVCNACGDFHPMGICVSLEDGPAAKQSIADVYTGKELPPSLAALKDKRVYCPKNWKTVFPKRQQEGLSCCNRLGHCQAGREPQRVDFYTSGNCELGVWRSEIG
jgi:hypothetical protein